MLYIIYRKRNEFDPRLDSDRSNNVLTENDIDYLADITNGKCGLVNLVRKPSNNDHSMECCSNIEIATSKHIEEPLSVVELFENFGECSFKMLIEFMSVDIDQQTLVQEIDVKSK